MFRFTIRDVLWLTVVVALACAWWISHRERNELLGKISGSANEIRALETDAKSQKEERDSIVIALAEELEKSLGRKLSGWSSVPDPENPKRRMLQLRYAESGPSSN